MLRRKFDPYKWSHQRRKGRSLFFVDHGLVPGMVAGIAFAVLMALLGQESSVYLNAGLFTLISTPVYVAIAWVMWETNEEAFAHWVVKEGRRLQMRGSIHN